MTDDRLILWALARCDLPRRPKIFWNWPDMSGKKWHFKKRLSKPSIPLDEDEMGLPILNDEARREILKAIGECKG
jgi:hypothetical protein